MVSVASDPQQGTSGGRRFSRRGLLKGAAGAVAFGGLGALGASLAESQGAGGTTRLPSSAAPSGATIDDARGERFFVTRRDLVPPHLQMTIVTQEPSGGYILLTPSALPGKRGIDAAVEVDEGLGQPGVMIIDELGRLVWFKPTNGLATDLQVQTYKGKPVLTYWEGRIGPGIGFGTGYILDDTYTQIATVNAGNGVQTDLHELQLTPQGTALITAYAERSADLSSVGGPKAGKVWDSVVQEIDIATGKVLLDWRSLDHVPVSDTYQGLTKGTFDYFHVNSVSLYNDAELLISSRNTWALYRVDRKTGAVIARINGKASDYEMGPGTHFYWQHHTRHLGGGVLTVFDDGATPPEEPASRGLVLLVNDTKKTVALRQAFIHPAKLLTPYEGSVQLNPDGTAFIGWGGQPYFSQFAADGTLTIDGRLPTNAQSYRAFRSPWVGNPKTVPDVVVTTDSLKQVVVHVSWNGATQVANWQVRNGATPSALTPLVTYPRAGFETAITTRPKEKYLAVAALDAKGAVLAVSKTLTL